MKTLAFQALKTVTLGRSMQFGSTKVQTSREDEAVVKPETKEQKAEEKNGPGMNVEEKMIPPEKALKKTVSINDNVEEINGSNKRKKRSKSFRKSNSLEHQQEEREEIKPLRSILRVKSNLDEISVS